MSDSVWPHRWQLTRLPHPWDSPGKNIGVGCHFLLQCMKVKSESEVAQSCPTLSIPMDCSLPGSSIHGFSKQEYWSGVPLPSPTVARGDIKWLGNWRLRINSQERRNLEGLKPSILAKSEGSYLILSKKKKKKNQKELRKNEQRLIQQARRTQVHAESLLVQIVEKVILTVLYLLHLPTPDSFPISTPTPFTASLPETSPVLELALFFLLFTKTPS